MGNEDISAGELPGVDDTTAVGIVVQDASMVPPRAHLAFAWGPEVRPAPSLPFGRWKPGTKAA